MEKKQKSGYITLLSVISMLAVVILHSNGCFWAFSAEARYWKTANVIESVFYFAVPVFFMISGATLLDFRERYDTAAYWKKRALKTVVPFLFWSLFGVAWRFWALRDLDPRQYGFFGIVNGILNTEFVGIYWFFLPLFFLYAVIPLLALIPKEKKAEVCGAAALTLAVTTSVIPFFLNVFHTGVRWPLDPGTPTAYLLYVFLGYYLSRKEIPKPWRITLYVLALAGLAAHIVGTYVLSMRAGEIVTTFKGYVNLPCVLYAAGIFVFFKTLGDRLMAHPFPGKLINYLAPHTFTVYLLHWFILSAFLKLAGHFGLDLGPILWYRLGAVIVVVPLCLLADLVVRKIPVVRYLLPA